MEKRIQKFEKNFFIFFITFFFGILFSYFTLFGIAKFSIAKAESLLDQKIKNGFVDEENWNEKIFQKSENLKFPASFADFVSVINFKTNFEKDLKVEEEKILNKKKENLMKILLDMETRLNYYDSFEIENRENYFNSINYVKKILTSEALTINDLERERSGLAKKDEELEKQAEKLKHDLLIKSLENSLEDADKLLNFYKSFKGYSEEVLSLQKYKKDVLELVNSEKLSETSFDELKTFLEQNIYPSIEGPLSKKRNIDEEYQKKRLNWIAEEKAKRERYGLGEAPKPPKEDVEKIIYVNLKSQKMYLYDKGELIFSTPITSGRSGFETVKGDFKIYAKTPNKRLISPFTKDKESPLYYDLLVQYWMPFFEGYGIHDAYWRRSFGGSDYIWNGSHGCLNTPLEAVKFIWNWAEIGTTVYID
ncbi:MAG: hypothetical protein Fur0024_3920 [Patescibacteria group bacterium]